MALMLTRVQVEYFDMHYICKVYSLSELVTEKLLCIMRSFVKNVWLEAFTG